MSYAFYPGCVSRGGCPELYISTMAVAAKIGLELEEIVGASCTGAGVLQERGLRLGDSLNARTFAMAERMGHTTIMNICSTCQGVMAQANHRLLADPDYLDEINQVLAEEELEYQGRVVIKHLAWVLVEEVGLDVLAPAHHEPLAGPEDSALLRLLHSPSHRGRWASTKTPGASNTWSRLSSCAAASR